MQTLDTPEILTLIKHNYMRLLPNNYESLLQQTKQPGYSITPEELLDCLATLVMSGFIYFDNEYVPTEAGWDIQMELTPWLMQVMRD